MSPIVQAFRTIITPEAVYTIAMRLLPAVPASMSPPQVPPWNRQLLTGHRGAAAYARENSLASFLLAIEMGADILECDVRMTRDRALVLAHDGIVGRGRATTRIAWETEADLRARVPDLLSLADLLGVVQARGVLLNVDLKVSEAEVALVGMLAAHDLLHRTVVTSRASYQLRRLRALAPALRLGLSKGSSPPRGPHGAPEWGALVSQRPLLPRALPTILHRARADAAYLHHRLITPPLAAALHRAGFGLYAWTVDAPADAERLIGWGVDGITTNRPDHIRPLMLALPNTINDEKEVPHGRHNSR
ncbi:MAG: glycerophosphodiester phosphodiesterase [Thermomicrobiales bacterium]